MLAVILDPPTGKGNFFGGGHVPPHYKLYGHAVLSCRKEGTDPTDMRFGMESGKPKNDVFGEGPDTPRGMGNLRGCSPIKNALQLRERRKSK